MFILCRLTDTGYSIGTRVLELSSFREKRREVNIIQMLQFLQLNIWKTLFGKAADRLERADSNANQCNYISTLSFCVFWLCL